MRRFRGPALLVGAVLLGACAGPGEPAAEPEGQEQSVGAEDTVDLDQVRATGDVVRDRTRDVVAAAAGRGFTPAGASGSWTTCTDDASAWQYAAQARLDAPSGSSSGELLDDVAAAVAEETGWTPGDIEDLTGRRRVGGPLADVDVSLSAYPDLPLLLVSVLGPCLPVAEADRDGLPAGSQDIDVGGAGG